ncbi:hypothetical protein H4J45_00310 [Colwellia sp. BRX10-6]|nr:hypothetical protein [Colwellia sp. BRX10-6]
MKVRVRRPNYIDSANDVTSFNGSGIGLLTLSEDNQTITTEIIQQKEKLFALSNSCNTAKSDKQLELNIEQLFD